MGLVFDINADLAMFRKPYTTTSQVSFAFPPPTAIAGIIGALAGIDHGSGREASAANYWNEMQGMRVGVRCMQPIRWFTTTINLLRFKSPNGDMNEHIQSKHQMVKHPAYRIYVDGGKGYDLLKKRLERNEFVYTPYLGVAYALADIKYMGEFSVEPVYDSATWIDSILPLNPSAKLDVMKSWALHRERVPVKMNAIRNLQMTQTVIYQDIHKTSDDDCEGRNRIWLKDRGQTEVSCLGEERVCWFERW